MENKNVLKGLLFVGLGASFYGMLATFVRVAYNNGYTTAEVTTAQFTIGILGLFLLTSYQSKKSSQPRIKPTKKERLQLITAGTSFGGTSLFYYLSVQYIDVSIAIVMLMQSIWISVVLEAILEKKIPSKEKVIATLIVLFGSVLATNSFQSDISIDIRGVFWGILAACSYTTTMFTSNRIATHLPPIQKSLIMLLGGSVLIFLFLIFSQIGPLHSSFFESIYFSFTDNADGVKPFDFSIFYTYGLFLAIFGTILPPIFLNKGFPLAGLGLGSIVSSIELPVSVTFAYIVLGEQTFLVQWFGILLILAAIVLMNWRKLKRPRS